MRIVDQAGACREGVGGSVGAKRGDEFYRNNFDLVRLFAALQVVMAHCILYLGIPNNEVFRLLRYLPGVPIFFFISGYLVSASWEKRGDIASYAQARSLRIFPALWVSLIFSAIVILVLDTQTLRRNIGTFVIWMIGQGTILQDWSPMVFSGYGSGVMNPALWTIPIELSFYIFLPLLLLMCGSRKGIFYWLTGAIMAISLAVNYVIYSFYYPPVPHGTVDLAKLVMFSPVPWVWMFCCGLLAQRNFEFLYPILRGRFLMFLGLFVLVSFISNILPFPPFLQNRSEATGLFDYAAMCLLVLSFAYSFESLASKLLRGNDLSYGVYLIHIPIINIFVMMEFRGDWVFPAITLLSLLYAFASWKLVELPALRLRQEITFWRKPLSRKSA